MSTADSTRLARRSPRADDRRGVPRHGAVLVAGLSVTVWFAAAVMLVLDRDVLTGPPVMNGNARGTVLVMAALAVPLLLLAFVGAARGAAWAPLLWLGACAHLVYNGVLLLFATPFNSLFLAYVAAFALALGAGATMLRDVDATTLGEHVGRGFPARPLAVLVWVVVVLNTLAWLRVVVPAVLSGSPGGFLAGSGLTTSPTYVQDLAVWLPLMAVAAWWLWQRLPWGFLLTGAGLTFWTTESVGVAVDQWFGHRADATNTWASPTAALLFAAFAVVTLAAALPFYRAVRTRPLR